MIPVRRTTSSYSYSSSKKSVKPRSMSLPSPSPQLPPNLPSDPKRWTSSHVASYLTYCLRLHPPIIISDLVRYVEEDTTLTGRKFLRLKEEQLRQMNFNERWIKLIMIGIRELRREHLKGKILLNGGDLVNEEPDEMGFGEETEDRFPLERSSSYSSTTTTVIGSNSSYSGNDFEDFLVPTSFSNLTSDDKEFIRREFNKLKDSLRYDVENPPHDINFNGLNQIIEKAISNTETNQEDHIKKPSITKRSLFSLFPLFSFDWLSGEWLKKTNLGSGFAQGVMIGGAVVWVYMKYSK